VIKNLSKILLLGITLVALTMTFILPQASAAPGELLFPILNPFPEANDGLGARAVSTPNGDILTGAQGDDTGAPNAGSAYLFDGNTGALLLTIPNPTPETDDFFGAFVTSNPNGDLIVGARSDNTGATSAGSVYLFDADCDVDVDDTNPEDIAGDRICKIPKLTIHNPTPETDDFFSFDLASTPNGDIIVGAHGDNTGATSAGSVYLFDGTDGALLLTINNPTPVTNEQFGARVASTPSGDVLVTAFLDSTGAFHAGSAYLFDVSTCDNAVGSTPDDDICEVPTLTINNPTPAASDIFGESIAATPNGDIIIGAIFDDAAGTDAGTAYLFDADCDNITFPIGTAGDGVCETPELTIYNPTPAIGDQFGVSVSSTPTGDIIVGAYHDNTGATNAGSAYLFDVSTCDNDLTAPGSVAGDKICETATLTINNPTPAASDAFGVVVVSTPGGNILVTAFSDNTGATNAGSAYLFEGVDLTPQEELEDLIQQLEEAVANEEIGNEANGILAKLNQIIEKLEKEHSNAACNQLSAFISQIEGILENGTQDEINTLNPILAAADSFQMSHC